MVEQRVEMALEVASFGYVLVQGQVRLASPAQALRESEDELAELFFRGGAPPVPASGGQAAGQTGSGMGLYLEAVGFGVVAAASIASARWASRFNSGSRTCSTSGTARS